MTTYSKHPIDIRKSPIAKLKEDLEKLREKVKSRLLCIITYTNYV